MAQTNTRVYYPNQALYIKPNGASGAYTFVHGMQTGSDSVDIATQEVNEWGQVAVYETIEDIATVQLDVERVLDGCSPAYLLATEGAASASLTGRQDQKCIIAVGIYDSTADYSSGTPVKVVEYSGLQVNSISYSFTTDGPFTETLSFVGNYREVSNGGSNKYGSLPSDPTGSGTDVPCAYLACSGGVQFKHNLVFDSGALWPTLLPTQIYGITGDGYNPVTEGGCPEVPIQSIEISADLSREDVPSLGCRGVYARLAQFPVDVNVTITVLARDGDDLNITEDGAVTNGCRRENAPNQRFRLSTDSGIIIDCGSKLKLTNFSTTYGDASGGNTQYTYSFVSKSQMSVFHFLSDPSGFAYAGSP